MVSAAISRVAMTSPGEERKILSRLITAAGLRSSITCPHVAAPTPAGQVVVPVQPTSVVENRHDRHGNLMQGTYDDRFVCRRARGTLWHWIGAATKQKPPPECSSGGFISKAWQ